MTIRHLLVDLAGVICRFERTRRLSALAAAAGTTVPEVEESVYGSGLSERFDRGEFSSAEVCQALRERLDLTVSDPDLATLWACAFIPDEAVLSLVDRVRPEVTRSLLTNNDALLRDFMPMVLPDVHARFSLPIFSSLTRALKPAPAAYTQALTLLGATPDESFFIDDSQSNVDGALAVGMTAVLFETVEGLTADLAAADLLLPG